MPRPHNPDHPRTHHRGGKKALQVYLPQDLHSEVHFAARIEGVSASDYVADLLHEKRTPKIGFRSVINWLNTKYSTQRFVSDDCIEAMRTLDDQSINLVITSPPYNTGKRYGATSDCLTLDEYVAFSKLWMTEAARVLHQDGSLWINTANTRDPDGGMIPIEYLLWPIGKELGLTLVQSIVWNHHTGKPQKSKFTQITERWQWWAKKSKGFIWNLDAVRVPPKSKDKRNNIYGANPTDLWNFPSLVHGSKTRPNHPCPYPIPMIERIIKACSNTGGVILDPFGGSGSTALAAQRHGREFISVEIDPGFHEVAIKRFEQATQETVQPDQPKRAA